jgi:hypothetical protein
MGMVCCPPGVHCQARAAAVRVTPQLRWRVARAAAAAACAPRPRTAHSDLVPMRVAGPAASEGPAEPECRGGRRASEIRHGDAASACLALRLSVGAVDARQAGPPRASVCRAPAPPGFYSTGCAPAAKQAGPGLGPARACAPPRAPRAAMRGVPPSRVDPPLAVAGIFAVPAPALRARLRHREAPLLPTPSPADVHPALFRTERSHPIARGNK